MEKDWKQVFLTGEFYKAEMAHDLLENNGIHSVILNQKDTVYKIFGDIAVFVNKTNEEQAIEILNEL